MKRIRNPIQILENLDSTQMTEFLFELIYLEDMMNDHLYAWKNVRIVSEYQQSLLRKKNYEQNSLQYIKTDVLLELKGKNLEELDQIEDNCGRYLLDDSNKVLDLNYWENVVKYCKIVRAKLMLRGYYNQYLNLIAERSTSIGSKNFKVQKNNYETNKFPQNISSNEQEDTHIPFFSKENIKFKELLSLSVSTFEDVLNINKLRSKTLDDMSKSLMTDLSVSNPAAYELETLPTSEIVSQSINRNNTRITNELIKIIFSIKKLV